MLSTTNVYLNYFNLNVTKVISLIFNYFNVRLHVSLSASFSISIPLLKK